MATTLSLAALLSATDTTTASFLKTVYPMIAQAVEPPIFYAAILYWALFGYRIYAGHSPLAWKDFLAKAVMTVAIFATLNWSGLAQTIYGVFTSFMDGGANAVMGQMSVPDQLGEMVTSVDIGTRALRGLSVYQLGMIIQGFALFLVNVGLFAIAFFYMAIAKIGLAITMVLLPLFAAFFLFEQTRHWAINWLNTMLNNVLLYILVTAILRFGLSAFGSSFDSLVDAARQNDNGKAVGAVMLDSSTVVTNLLICEVVLILFMLGVRGWAAALASGAANSTGVLMMAIRAAATKSLK